MITFLTAFASFCLMDTLLTHIHLEGIYYLIHSVHNAAIVYSTAPDIYTTIVHYDTLATLGNKNTFALELVFALHIYHIAYYWRKFRYDDWLHHGLMIGLALPIGTYLESGSLLGYSLFFTTGLPGCIDYFLLFLTRNNCIEKDTEKRVNYYLNTWIRSPGTASHAILTLIFLLHTYPYSFVQVLGLLTAFLNYWNGQYFMAQIVYDAGVRRLWN